MTENRKLKRVVIKEELVAVTGDFMLAIILNQFLYWTERAKDFDKMLIEEKAIAEREGIDLKTPLKCGWVYKKAEELIEETMLGISQTGMRSKIKTLIKMGFLSERNNPNYKWDHTKQYRVNFHILKRELEKQGYNLQGYKMLENGENIEAQNLSFEPQTVENRISKFELHNSNFEEQYQRLQSEIRTDNICSKEKNIKKEISENGVSETDPEETAVSSKKEIPITFKSDTPHFQKGHPPLSKGTRNTEITTKTNNQERNIERKKEKGSKKNNTLCDAIDSYTTNEELRKELKEHLETRKAKKATLTVRALELSFKELDKLADNDSDKILIVQEAIMRGWPSFYQLKKDQSKAKNKLCAEQRSFTSDSLKHDPFENKPAPEEVNPAEKEINAAEEEKPKTITEAIDAYTKNEELKDNLIKCFGMWKKQKSITLNFLESELENLSSLSGGSDSMAIWLAKRVISGNYSSFSDVC